MYLHGTAVQYEQVDPDRFQMGSFGRGYYLTSSWTTAEEYGRNKVKGSKPYIRRVDVPDHLWLLDLGHRVSQEILDVVARSKVFTHRESSLYPDTLKTWQGQHADHLNGADFWDMLAEIVGQEYVNEVLEEVGLRGMRWTDPRTGEVYVVIFPKGLKYLRNLDTGKMEANPARRRGYR
jgi:hypothetical protein